MEHKRISRLLIFAGAMAGVGLLLVMFAQIPITSVGAEEPQPPFLLPLPLKLAATLPYLAALAYYFRISANIGRERSFCRENVRSMHRIVLCLVAAACVWAIVLALLLCGALLDPSAPTRILFEVAVTLAATLAVALVAWCMERLVDHAVSLQEDCDLTI